MKRPGRAALAAVAAAVLAVAGTVTATGSTVPEAEADAPVEAALAMFRSAVVEPGAQVSAVVTIDNTTAAPLTEVVLAMHVTQEPLATVEALDAFLEDPRAQALTRVTQDPLPPEPLEDVDATDEEAEADPEPPGITLGTGGATSLTVMAGPEELGLPQEQWGVYGIVLEVEVGEESYAVDALPITWAGAEVPTLPVSVLASARGQDNRVDALLSAADVPGVAVAIDPAALTSAQVFDQGLLERDVYRLPAGDPDLTSLAHAGDEHVLALSLATPAGTSLGAFDAAPWLAQPAAVDGSTAGFAAAHGAAAALVLADAPGHDEASSTGQAVVVAAAEEDAGATLLVADPILSTTLASFRPGTEAARTVLVAQSALMAGAGAGTPVLVAPGPGWQVGGTGPSPALSALVEAPWTDVVPVAELLDEEAGAVELAAELDADRDLPADQVDALGARIADLQTLSTITELPDRALTDWGTPVVEAVPTALRGDVTARDAAASSGITAADATLAGVRIAESSELNLLADSGDIPLTVVNALDRPVTVTVDLTSLSPNLQVGERPVVTVPAGQELLAPIAVEAVSSANVQLRAVLRNDAGVAVSDVQTFSVRVRADWGTLATAVFSVLLVLLMIAGVVRTIRRGRKDTRARPGPAPATAPSTSDEIPVAGDQGDLGDQGGPEGEDAHDGRR